MRRTQNQITIVIDGSRGTGERAVTRFAEEWVRVSTYDGIEEMGKVYANDLRCKVYDVNFIKVAETYPECKQAHLDKVSDEACIVTDASTAVDSGFTVQ